ncbi:MAG: GntR family transcriptional regulator [Butyrivibrio sp.]
MFFSIDFNSDEALYIQLCNQIIMSIANEQIREGDSLPSVRQMADTIGINMHTVNKAYTVLRQEGYIKLDRRHGAIIAVDVDKLRSMQELSDDLKVVIAKAMCKNVSAEEIHALVDDIITEFTN